MKGIYCCYKLSLQPLLAAYILHFKNLLKMKGFIDERPACIKSLEGTFFLTTDLTQILAGGCSTIFFNHTFFFFHWNIWNKNLLSTEKTETQVIKEQDDPAKESVGYSGLHLCAKHRNEDHSFLEWRIVGKIARGARTNISLFTESDHMPEGWKELDEY